MFRGRKLLIVTKHGKERVIADLAESALGVECIVADEFDTDLLGTFTGEIGRPGDALETLRRKCHEGLALYGCDLAIASEGSFGPHPAIFIASGDDELVMLVDTLNGLEIVARELTVDTNFSAATINSKEELDHFLQLARFPGHAVIVRRAENDTTAMIKGISDPEEMDSISREYLEKYGSFFIETDMRAMHNPTRMQVIRRATAKLIERAGSLCPACGTPGFGVTSVKAGLPCSACRCETDSTLSHISVCAKCSHTVEKLYPHGKNEEDPMYCNFCNP
ncbi:hypothetical protein HYN59_15950 [Flavobacterium album]|uniref:DUF6671 domain-containing protein n=2 Tax=Flavobacterium album TaxID=2175091 RepID=A0A2S1R1P9_9FLAO|nr:DUF6671 family protein [Flavobacterium album]AWH86509.1 hypothetical protein HYN59_15950 [Flavobacterium album]